jgi:putative transposase
MSPKPTFLPSNVRAAYQLRYHFGWSTKGRKPILSSSMVRSKVESTIREVAEKWNYHLLGLDVDANVVRTLISLRPVDSPESVTKKIKGNIATKLRSDGISDMWSRGWFVRSNGNVSDEVIRSYVKKQLDHHQAIPSQNPSVMINCRYHNRSDPSQIRKSSHAAFQYNIHFVFSVRRRVEFLDPTAGQELVEYWLSVCRKKSWIAWDVEVVWDHAHLFLGISPSETPEQTALALMNNAEHWLQSRYGAAMRQLGLSTVFQEGYYAGTSGEATTAQIKSFLECDFDAE